MIYISRVKEETNPRYEELIKQTSEKLKDISEKSEPLPYEPGTLQQDG